ncbi:MAG: DUF669 domain-containing protein [Candidatus Caldarchaeum sp.]
MSILDLSGADTTGFQPLPAGSYNASVYDIELSETRGGGKLPAGVPMVRVRFSVLDPPYEGRALFVNYPLPNADQSDNSSRLLGSFLNFLAALGENPDTLRKKGFDLRKLDELVGRECVVRVAVSEWDGEPTNTVRGVKPAGSPVSAGGSDLL